MILNSERLEIVCLTLEQLKMWCENIDLLGKNLDFKHEGQALTGDFLDIVKGQIEVCEKNPENHLWHTFWMIIRKSDRVLVGSCDFKNKPNEEGEVEIGYGLDEGYEHNGYMTECIRELSSFGLAQKGVNSIIGETEGDNLGSQRVLMRCGFSLYNNEGVNMWWRL